VRVKTFGAAMAVWTENVVKPQVQVKEVTDPASGRASGDIDRYYLAHPEKYQRRLRAQVRYIFLPVDLHNEEAKQRARGELSTLAEQIKSGAQTFEEAARDDSLEAIVFRVDSPGGSALASDLIWRATRTAAARKPVIVSMSDVAGSGGYYVAAGANHIVAQPGTMTGSIGVVLAKPNIKGLLAKIGIKLSIQTMAASAVIEQGGTEGKLPMVWSGGLAWIQDYPDPDDFYAPILGCGSAVQGGWNWSWYCNESVDKQASQLLGTTDRTARMNGYKELFRKVMDDAVWVPVYHLEQYIGHSDALHGDQADFIHPEHTFVYEQLWKGK
jgi:hypothetical protein